MWTNADFANTRWVERRLGAYYVGKHGDDRSDGHPQRPVASIEQGLMLARTGPQSGEGGLGDYWQVVVSSGVYNETINGTNALVVGDGNVILDGASNGSLVYTPSFRVAMYNVTIQNYAQLISAGGYAVHNVNLVKCVVRNLDTFGSAGRSTMVVSAQNTLLDHAPRNPVYDQMHLSFDLDHVTALGAVFASRDYLFVNGTIYSTFRNSYADADCVLGKPANGVFLLQNSNFQGTLGTSAAPFTYQRLADFQLSNANAAVNCVSVAPGFNNPLAGDYTLASTSQMRNLAFDGGYVGAFGIGINFSGLADADTLTNSQWNSQLGAFVLQNSQSPGLIEFVVKDFQRNWILEEALLVGQEDGVDNQTVDSTLSYEVDSFGAPANVQSGALMATYSYWITGYDTVTYKGQVYYAGQFFSCTADDLTYTSSGAGKVVRLVEAPNIRLYEMKFSAVSAVDCVSRPWQYFVFNKVPSVDAAGRSNGDPQFNPATANPITVRWLKLRLTLMPNSLA